MGACFTRFIFCAALVFFLSPALAEHASFPCSQPPPSFDSDYLVNGETSSPSVLTVTIAGDCTLGGTESARNKADGLYKTVQKRGLAYPFSELLSLFSKDDLTLVNLEGVLSDSSFNENTDKEFSFRGPAAYAQMLTLGSVEAVNLSNNHHDDYGKTGRILTLQALDKQGVAYAGNEWLCVFKTDRGKIGLAGIKGSLTEKKKETVANQIALLKEADCAIILYSLHAGQEYASKHNHLQRDMARFLIDAGADVVAGHHPHVVQGIEIYKNRLIFYSLGNCVFGGNHHPRDTDALVASITFTLNRGRLKSLQAALHPIRFTGGNNSNTYQPILLSDLKAEDVLKKVQQDTPFPIPAFEESLGALLPPIPAE